MDSLVFKVLDCNPMKPGERVRTSETPLCGYTCWCRTGGWVWCTRGNGYGGVVRTMVPPRGMGPGLPPPSFYRVFRVFREFRWFSWISVIFVNLLSRVRFMLSRVRFMLSRVRFGSSGGPVWVQCGSSGGPVWVQWCPLVVFLVVSIGGVTVVSFLNTFCTFSPNPALNAGLFWYFSLRQKSGVTSGVMSGVTVWSINGSINDTFLTFWPKNPIQSPGLWHFCHFG